MQKAVGILALEDPNILMTKPSDKPKPKTASVERPRTSVGGPADTINLPEGIARLRARMADNEKKGVSGLAAAKDRALQMMKNLKG